MIILQLCILLDLSTLEKYDLQKMYKVYDRWPELSRQVYESEIESANLGEFNHIIFAGMGGSGAIGDIFSSILSKSKIHVSVVKGYHLPSTVNSETLIVTTSISGNTVETLVTLDEARKKGSKIISFFSGGKMEEYCHKHNIVYRKIAQEHSPRASFTKFLYSMISTLDSTIPLKSKDVLESISKLEKTREVISSSNLVSSENPALDLAEWLNKIPLIYYPFGLQAVAIRFKNSLQENAKSHAMAEDVIESSHNGIVSWERESNIQPILVEGQDDYIKTKERWQILKCFFKENNIEYKEIISENGNILTKIVNLIYLLDYSTIFKAVLDEIDPSPVKSIDFIKSKLN